MNYHNIASHSGPVPLPSLMYVDCPPLPPPQQQQDMQHPQTKKRPNKVHVSAACINCKKAHLACDVSRPCNRCVTTDKADTCRDIQHKKRGRPKMMRDANNNKIRPAAVTQSMSSNHRIMSGPNVDFFSMVPAATSNDMMTVFLSMDLCCARVSDKSLEYLELYPQEFGHRSLYDFLVPGETQSSLSKLHRCLLDNAVQHQQHTRLPHDLLRSSSEKFFSFSIDSLLNIANGSLTLKQKLKFKKGRGGGDSSDYEEMNCRFYLGGAFGADLFDASTFDQLYIVCIASPIVSAMNINDVIHLPPLMMNGNNDSCSTVSSPVSPPPPVTTTAASPPPPPTEQCSKPADHEIEQDDDMHAAGGDGNNSGCSSPTATPSNTIQLPLLPSNNNHQQQPAFDNNSKSVLDRFRYNTKTPTQQFIHPNELYYLQTTSSRLSSEAIAHTAYPYLSKTPASAAAVGSGPLANYNNQFKK
ncbi:Zn(2)-C6 fungal-specific transcription factor [Mucor lusitanicus CBS 277.49]|uniref:Zn(2)-C6 fungal-specific transcription factor n=1 Tax=Mucor lusitanicus CBS 277.49 TaxID=747725 RepID=A0A168HC83_MUCCL|nr:Zn(2)-C6 fungal-specific transcription factor [Mucor lusitanicus CBS 277.49]